VEYRGAVVYTRNTKLPEVLLPQLREAAKKVNFDFDSDFKKTNNLCKVMQDGERFKLREKFASKMTIQMEKQLQNQDVLAKVPPQAATWEWQRRRPRMLCRGSRTMQSSLRRSWSRVVRTVYLHLV
jgi:hypothetical protein